MQLKQDCTSQHAVPLAWLWSRFHMYSFRFFLLFETYVLSLIDGWI
jgi:hypothetical protein